MKDEHQGGAVTEKSEESAATEVATDVDPECFREWINRHPDEVMKISKRNIAYFIIMVVIAMILASKDAYHGPIVNFIFGSPHVSGLSVLEMIAILITLFLSITYAKEMIRESMDKQGAFAGQEVGYRFFIIGGGSVLNCIVICGAGVVLRLYTGSGETKFGLYVAYVVLTFAAFLIFTILDFMAAHLSRGFRLARMYWGLSLLCDGPAAVGFLLLLVYIGVFSLRSGAPPPIETIGGAVAMQLMIANAIYIGIATNFFFMLYKKFACDGVEKL